MKILILGSGGREHALCWKVSQSPLAASLICAPGNAGTARLAENVRLDIEKPDEVREFVLNRQIDFVVIGPEAPLVAGVADALRAAGIDVFGPGQDGAMLEGSKRFAKEFMVRHRIPTGTARTFTSAPEALAYIETQPLPIVIKADGLAAGKGVYIVKDAKAARAAIDECFLHKRFGAAGEEVLIEEYLEGQEVSLLSFFDGKTILPMVPAQDYKRAFDGDEGPNTGGMGSYSPVPCFDEATFKDIVAKIINPVAAGLQEEGIDYRGVLYTGIILTDDGPKVLEFNARFGDPETQAIVPRMSGDLLDVMLKTARQELAGTMLEWSDKVCVCVVVSSGGYPNDYETGFVINGLDETAFSPDVVVFHAGTTIKNNEVLTCGGRVLSVSAMGATFDEARDRAYDAITNISFEKMRYRTDIALRACETRA